MTVDWTDAQRDRMLDQADRRLSLREREVRSMERLSAQQELLLRLQVTAKEAENEAARADQGG